MILSRLKATIVVTLFILGTIFYHFSETVAFEIVDSKVSSTVQIHVSAKFRTVGFVKVEHERLSVPQMDKEFWKNNSFIKNAKISVHGKTGEVVSISCSIVNGTVTSRDCEGSHLKPKEIVSGESINTNVAITYDMIKDMDKSEKFVLMQVLYI